MARKYRKILTFLSLVFILLYTWYITKDSFSCNYLFNGDGSFHFWVAKKIASRSLMDLKDYGWIDYDGGYPHLLLYSPLFYLTFAFLHSIANFVSIYYLWTIYLFLIILGISVSGFILFKEMKFPILISILFSIVLIGWRPAYIDDFSPSVIYSVSIVPFCFSIMFLLLYLMSFYELFKNFKIRWIIFSSFLLGLILISHVYTFVVSILFSTFYAIYYLIKNFRNRNFLENIIKLAVVPIIFGFLFSFYLMPILEYQKYSIYPNQNFEVVSKRFFEVFKNKVFDNSIPLITLFGFVGLIIPISKYKIQSIFLLIFLVTVVLINFGLLNYLKIPFTGSLAYIHGYGRGLAYVKLAWVAFACIGILNLLNLLNKIKIKHLATGIMIILILIITLDQINHKKKFDGYVFRCLDGRERASFQKPYKYINDIDNISSILAKKNKGKIFFDNKLPMTFYMKILMMTEHGFEDEWPTAFTFHKLRHSNFLLFDYYHSKNYEKFIWLSDIKKINYFVISKEIFEKSILETGLIKNDLKVIYDGDIMLLERNKIFPKHEEVGKVVVLLDDEIFWKDINYWRNFLDSVSTSNITFIVSQGNADEEIMKYSQGFLIGDVDCEIVNKLNQTKPIFFVKSKCGEKTEIKNVLDFFEKTDPVIFDKEFIKIPISYYPNFRIYKKNSEIRKYFILPEGIIVLSDDTKDLSIKTRLTLLQKISLIVTIITSIFVIFLLKNEKNVDKIEIYHLKKISGMLKRKHKKKKNKNV